jgi:D-glycero-alpha-D-manno-heptose 1-phosphate guanylyltransferase
MSGFVKVLAIRFAAIRMTKPDAIILAGGLGTRLQGTLPHLPKVLAPINGTPFLDILMKSLDNSHLVSRLIIAVGYMAGHIIKRYRNTKQYGFKIAFSEERELLGTGGAVKKALEYSDSANVLCFNGDSYVEVDLKELIGFHEKKGGAMTIVVKRVDNVDRYGSVRCDDKERIISFEEKEPSKDGGFVNAGLYVFRRELFDGVESNRAISFEKELLPGFVNKGIFAYVSRGRFIDIGTAESYKEADHFFTGSVL